MTPDPVRGLRFVHARLLGEDNRPAECVVTAARDGVVYYRRTDERAAKEYCTLTRWPQVCASVLTGADPSLMADNTRMRKLPRRDSGPEALRVALRELGLTAYRVNYSTPYGCKVDVVFTRWRVAVFIDSCFGHRCPKHYKAPKDEAAYWDERTTRTVEQDRADDHSLESAGWLVVRVWEHEDPAAAADRVYLAIETRRPNRNQNDDVDA